MTACLHPYFIQYQGTSRSCDPCPVELGGNHCGVTWEVGEKSADITADRVPLFLFMLSTPHLFSSFPMLSSFIFFLFYFSVFIHKEHMRYSPISCHRTSNKLHVWVHNPFPFGYRCGIFLVIKGFKEISPPSQQKMSNCKV